MSGCVRKGDRIRVAAMKSSSWLAILLASLCASASASAEPFRVLEYRWGNQIASSVLIIYSDGSYEGEDLLTFGGPDDTTRHSGKLSQHDLKLLLGSVGELSGAIVEQSDGP